MSKSYRDRENHFRNRVIPEDALGYSGIREKKLEQKKNGARLYLIDEVPETVRKKILTKVGDSYGRSKNRVSANIRKALQKERQANTQIERAKNKNFAKKEVQDFYKKDSGE